MQAMRFGDPPRKRYLRSVEHPLSFLRNCSAEAIRCATVVCPNCAYTLPF